MYIYSRTGFAPRLRNRARGLAGAEAGGAMQAVVAGQSAQGIAGAECRGSLVSYAKGYAGAEARGAPAIKALGFAGAEAGGTLEPSSPAYANGFKSYLEFLLPAASIKASGILNCLLSIDETFPELRTVANGGLVEHASGYDMQLELADGTVVSFARLAWDATTGRIVVRERFAAPAAAGVRFRLFFGKTVVADGANEGAAYAAHLMAPNIRTGADRTGLSRIWTPTSITAGTLAGYAATFNGSSSQLVRVNPTELNGLSSITIQALAQLAGIAADKPIFIAGPNTGSDFGLHLRFRVSDGRLVFTIQVGTNTTTVESPDGVMPAIGTPMLVAATWTSGQAPKLYVGGEIVDLAVAGTALTGTTNATLGASASEALIGYNRATGNRWNGQIADLMVSARALTEGHLQTQELAYLTPRDSYGVGSVNRASEGNLSPVLPPIFATATVGVMSEVDPALLAYEGDAGQVKTLETLTGTGGGTSNIVGGRAQFTPSAVGEARRIATVKDNGTPVKRSLAPIIWMASAAPVTAYPKWPMGYTSWTSVPVARIRPVGFGVVGAPGPSGGYTTIAAAYAAAATDDWIVVNDGTWPGNFTFNRDFGGNGIVICGRNIAANGRDPLTILTGKYAVSGDGHWFHHLRISYANTTDDNVEGTSSFGGHPFVVTAARNTWTRNWFTIPKGIQLNRGNGTHTNRICYNRWTTTRPQGNSWISFQNGQMAESDNWHHDTIVARNYMRQSTAATYQNSYLIHIGNAHAEPGNWWLWRGLKIERNLLIVSTASGYDKFVYLKFGVQSFSYNTMIGTASFIHRHGSIQYTTPASAKTASTQTCPQWHGNWMEGLSGGYASVVQLNGCGFDIRGNYIKASGGIRLFNGFQRDNNYEAQYQAASDSLLVGNQVVTNGGRPYIIGHVEDLLNYDATQGHKIKNVNIFGHTGAAVTGGVSSLFQDAAHIETGTCSFSTGYGSYPTPPAPVKLDETMVGFEVTGQAGTA